MNSTGWVAVAVVVVLIAGGAWWYTQQPAATNTNEQGIPNETGGNVPDTTATEPKTVTVNYTNSGFSPSTITINKGDTVTFTNSSSGNMWVASDEHPTHTAYAGTALSQHCPADSGVAFDQCVAGATYSFKFDKAGSWTYHNHAASQLGGTVVVQ